MGVERKALWLVQKYGQESQVLPKSQQNNVRKDLKNQLPVTSDQACKRSCVLEGQSIHLRVLTLSLIAQGA